MNLYAKKDRIQNDCIQGDIGVAPVEENMIENWLKWFEHAKKVPRSINGGSRLYGF